MCCWCFDYSGVGVSVGVSVGVCNVIDVVVLALWCVGVMVCWCADALMVDVMMLLVRCWCTVGALLGASRGRWQLMLCWVAAGNAGGIGSTIKIHRSPAASKLKESNASSVL